MGEGLQNQLPGEGWSGVGRRGENGKQDTTWQPSQFYALDEDKLRLDCSYYGRLAMNLGAEVVRSRGGWDLVRWSMHKKGNCIRILVFEPVWKSFCIVCMYVLRLYLSLYRWGLSPRSGYPFIRAHWRRGAFLRKFWSISLEDNRHRFSQPRQLADTDTCTHASRLVESDQLSSAQLSLCFSGRKARYVFPGLEYQSSELVRTGTCTSAQYTFMS